MKVHEMVMCRNQSNRANNYKLITVIPHPTSNCTLKEKVLYSFFFLLHIGHKVHGTDTCLLVRLTLIGSLPIRTLHTHTCAEPTPLIF